MKRNLLQELWLSMLTSMISFRYVNDTMIRIQVASYQVENIHNMHVDDNTVLSYQSCVLIDINEIILNYDDQISSFENSFYIA